VVSLLRFPDQISVNISLLQVCHMPRQFHPPYLTTHACLVKSTNHKAPMRIVVSVLLILLSFSSKIFPSAPCYPTHSVCVLLFTWYNKFHTHISNRQRTDFFLLTLDFPKENTGIKPPSSHFLPHLVLPPPSYHTANSLTTCLYVWSTGWKCFDRRDGKYPGDQH